jgi:hypothetical protein
MTTWVLNQNALTDDTITVLEDGKCYKLPKHPRVMVKYYTYANEWGDHEHVFFATTIENALKRYRALTKRAIDHIDVEELRFDANN